MSIKKGKEKHGEKRRKGGKSHLEEAS